MNHPLAERQTAWRAYLDKHGLEIVKGAIKENNFNPIKVVLKLWDINNERIYYWQTEEWTTLLLTRVN